MFPSIILFFFLTRDDDEGGDIYQRHHAEGEVGKGEGDIFGDQGGQGYRKHKGKKEKRLYDIRLSFKDMVDATATVGEKADEGGIGEGDDTSGEEKRIKFTADRGEGILCDDDIAVSDNGVL